MNQTLYQILEIPETATTVEIKDAYRRLAMKWHPDRNPNNKQLAEEKFKQIAYAYQVLSDQASRAEYDRWLMEQRQNATANAGGSGYQHQDTGMSDDDADKIFVENMLDLAMELAARGYDATAIAKALIALDCPEGVAKGVAASAVRFSGERRQNRQSSFQSNNSEKEDVDYEYAGFWQRLAALFLDGIVLTLFSIPVWVVMGVSAAGSGGDSQDGLMALGYLLLWVVSAIYYSTMEAGEKSATYGKRWVGLKVFDVNHQRISGGRALARWASHLFSYLTLYLGFLVQPFTARKQALHDLISGTVVVRSENKSSTAAMVIVIAFFFFLGIGVLAAIAIPAYHDYVIRAKVSEGVELGNAASSSVESYYLKNGKVPDSLDEAGLAVTTGKYISSMNVDPSNGQVYVQFGKNNPTEIAEQYLIISPSEGENKKISWACVSYQIQQKYLPKSCAKLDPPAQGKMSKIKSSPVFVKLETFTVRLSDGAEHYLQTDIELKVNGQKSADYIQAHLAQIRNNLLLLLSSKSASGLGSAEEKQRLVDQIKVQINNDLNMKEGEGVLAVYFTSFVIQ